MNEVTTIEINGALGTDGFCAADLVEAIKSHGRARILIDSDGGCVRSAVALADLIDGHGAPVTIKKAVSGAAIVATAGPDRTICADGFIGVHPAWLAIAGGYLELEAAAQQLRQTDALLAETLAKRSNLTVEAAAQARRRGRVWTADQALEDGLVDHIGPAAGLDTPPERIVDGPEREHHTLREQAKHYYLRAVREREISTATTEKIDNVDRFMSSLVEGCSPPDRLAGIFDHAAGDAKRRYLYQGHKRTLPRWRCDRCGHLNFTPPAIGFKPAACITCNANHEDTT